MKLFRNRKSVLLLTFFLLFGCIFLFSSDKINSYEDYLLSMVFHSLKNHYSYPVVRKKLGERVFNLFIDSIDGNKRFFLKEDVEKLSNLSRGITTKVDDRIFDFFNNSTNLLIKRIIESEKMAEEILSKPFDFEKEEEVLLEPDERDFPLNQKEKYELWRRLLKYEILNRILLKAGKDEKTDFSSIEEETIRQEVLKETKRMLERKLNDKNLFNRFVNSIASSFDAHTEYFPPSEREDFDINMTGTFEGIGARLMEVGEYIKVEEIIPGGPAAKQKMLNAGDIILKVAQSNESPVDVVNMPISDVVRLIRGKAGTEVRLTVKKPDGQIVVIPIIRGKVILEESYVKVAILKDGDRKVGYIQLPSFYRNFTSTTARNSTEDVFLALNSLVEYDMDGLILDLRNNGGGSLEDAVRISGLFINEGPIVQVKNNFGFTRSLYDPDPEIYYDGPLVILVNEMSASASEILSAALQDYGRAIIVGSKKTFGKGTVQILNDLGKFEGDNKSIPLGTLKITVQKFYRINGDSTQNKGVIPDIILPSPYGYVDLGEDYLKYPLEFDTIKPAKYKKWDSIDIEKLKEIAENRIKQNPLFTYIDLAVKSILENRKKPYPLSIKKAFSFYKELKLKSEEVLKQQTNSYKSIEAKWVNYRVEEKEDEDLKKKHNAWLSLISKDIYIQEAINILKDVKTLKEGSH